MPPQRDKATSMTTTSFAEAIVTGAPLSSHGAGHAPSLNRGMACIVCRNRKVKCDGVKPACGACSRSAIAHGEDPSKIECNYDEDETKKRRRGAGGQAKVKELQSRIAELEGLLAQKQAGSQPSPSNASSMQFGSSSMSEALVNANLDMLLQASGQTASSAAPSVFSAAPTSAVSRSFGRVLDVPHHLPFTASSASLPESGERSFLEILYPGWPRDLPSPDLVNRLVNVYFSKNHAATGMINQQKFLAALSLPPNNSGFPHPCLIHAMIATSVRMVSADFFGFENRYWGSEATPADYHAKRARAHVEEAIAGGKRLLQVLQATILLCFYSYSAARFVEVWLGCGLATRIATPLGINHLKPASEYSGGFLNAMRKPNLLPPTDDQEELHTRAVTFWLAFMADRFSSASTGWATSLDESEWYSICTTDVSTILPSCNGVYSLGNTDTSVLSPRHPHFLISHPPQHIQGFQLYIKAVILFGRIVNYLHRVPTSTAWKVGNPKAREPPVDVRMTPEFKQLDADAVSFRLSLPREYANMSPRVTDDNRLCLISALPHTATIMLHEPFATTKDDDLSMTRCVMSAKAILEAIYGLFSTSFDVGLLCPFINFCWAIAGRTLVRQLAIQQYRGITSGVDQLRADIECILAAMYAYSTELGQSTHKSLKMLYDEPSQCLPHDTLSDAPSSQPVCINYDMSVYSDALRKPNDARSSAIPFGPTSSSSSSPASFEIATPPAMNNPMSTGMSTGMSPLSMPVAASGMFPGSSITNVFDPTFESMMSTTYASSSSTTTVVAATSDFMDPRMYEDPQRKWQERYASTMTSASSQGFGAFSSGMTPPPPSTTGQFRAPDESTQPRGYFG
ncbi:hypothetical protein OIV83_004043 [Microbotryomycetes sp. JL201]|nr:hypothetical protein OIV83_004043 [Microbotryomycetes sp. JL201]